MSCHDELKVVICSTKEYFSWSWDQLSDHLRPTLPMAVAAALVVSLLPEFQTNEWIETTSNLPPRITAAQVMVMNLEERAS